MHPYRREARRASESSDDEDLEALPLEPPTWTFPLAAIFLIAGAALLLIGNFGGLFLFMIGTMFVRPWWKARFFS